MYVHVGCGDQGTVLRPRGLSLLSRASAPSLSLAWPPPANISPTVCVSSPCNFPSFFVNEY